MYFLCLDTANLAYHCRTNGHFWSLSVDRFVIAQNSILHGLQYFTQGCPSTSSHITVTGIRDVCVHDRVYSVIVAPQGGHRGAPRTHQPHYQSCIRVGEDIMHIVLLGALRKPTSRQ